MGLIFSIDTPTLPKMAVSVLFALANYFLVAHIWTLNDWADIHSDTLDCSRSARVFTRKGIAPSLMLGLSMALLSASLGLFAWLSLRTFAIAGSIAVLGFLYSFPGIRAKGIVLLSSIPHLVGGFLHFLLGHALFASVDRNTLLTALIFALI